jgi:hypothetical protein
MGKKCCSCLDLGASSHVNRYVILTRRAYCGFGKANTDQDAAAESMGC